VDLITAIFFQEMAFVAALPELALDYFIMQRAIYNFLTKSRVGAYFIAFFLQKGDCYEQAISPFFKVSIHRQSGAERRRFTFLGTGSEAMPHLCRSPIGYLFEANPKEIMEAKQQL
jgi:hypothetical protein